MIYHDVMKQQDTFITFFINHMRRDKAWRMMYMMVLALLSMAVCGVLIQMPVFFTTQGQCKNDSGYGLCSPNKEHFISVILSKNDQIKYQKSDSNETKIIAPEFVVSIDFSTWSSQNNPIEPFIWINNQSILTQKHNGELYIVSLDSSTQHIVTIPDIPDLISYPIFQRRNHEEFHYIVDHKKYIVNINEKTFSLSKWDYHAPRL